MKRNLFLLPALVATNLIVVPAVGLPIMLSGACSGILRWLIPVILILVANGGVAYWIVRKRPQEDLKLDLRIGILFVVGFLVFATQTFFHPHGSWDAWDNWNYKAKTVALECVTGVDFSYTREGWPHASYPPLHWITQGTLSIILGQWTQLIPIVTAFALYLSTVVLILLACRPGAGPGRALRYVAVLFAFASPAIAHLFANQIADGPVAFLMAMAVYIWYGVDTTENKRAVIAGIVLVAMALTKVEGMYSSLILCAGLGLDSILNQRRTKALILIGVCTIGGVLYLLHIMAAGQVQPYDIDLSVIFERAVDPYRYMIIAIAFVRLHIVLGAGMALAAFVVCTRRREYRWTALSLIAILLASNVAFLLAHPDVYWHTETAYDRVALQIFPAALVVLGFASSDRRLQKG